MDVGLFVIAFAHQTAFFRQATGHATERFPVSAEQKGALLSQWNLLAGHLR